MSDMKFTPAPWTYTVRDNHEIQCSFAGVVIGNEYIDLGFANEARDRANAHLIAAAPDMYEALADIVHDFEGHPGFGPARAALAKARGES